MSNSGGKITAPVSIEDVRTVLGVSSYDLGTLCKNTHGKIRILSISKPTDKFFPNEEVFVIPFLATYQNNTYYVIGLNNGYANNYAKFKIGSEVLVGSRGTISSGKAVISVLKNEDGTYTFYLAGGMDLDLTCSSSGDYISFVGNVNISQADGNSYTQKLTDGKWSGTMDSEISGG